jgi:hypothetical protein
LYRFVHVATQPAQAKSLRQRKVLRARVLASTSAGARASSNARQCKEKHVPSSNQLRQQEQHERKLKEIREQVANGKLVIRQMTAAERKRFPPRAPATTGGREKRR